MPCDATGAALNRENGFLGCVDPAPFYNGKYGEDIAIEQAIVQRASSVVTAVSQIHSMPVPQKLSILEELEAILAKFL